MDEDGEIGWVEEDGEAEARIMLVTLERDRKRMLGCKYKRLDPYHMHAAN